jgi:hypothetical protein
MKIEEQFTAEIAKGAEKKCSRLEGSRFQL